MSASYGVHDDDVPLVQDDNEENNSPSDELQLSSENESLRELRVTLSSRYDCRVDDLDDGEIMCKNSSCFRELSAEGATANVRNRFGEEGVERLVEVVDHVRRRGMRKIYLLFMAGIFTSLAMLGGAITGLVFTILYQADAEKEEGHVPPESYILLVFCVFMLALFVMPVLNIPLLLCSMHSGHSFPEVSEILNPYFVEKFGVAVFWSSGGCWQNDTSDSLAIIMAPLTAPPSATSRQQFIDDTRDVTEFVRLLRSSGV